MRNWLIGAAVMSVASAAHAQEYRQEYPFPADKVFAALIAELPAQGFKLKEQDVVIHRVVASAPMSAFSYGENLSISVTEASPGKSVLVLNNAKKVAINITANGRGQKNFDKIVLAVSRRLQAG